MDRNHTAEPEARIHAVECSCGSWPPRTLPSTRQRTPQVVRPRWTIHPHSCIPLSRYGTSIKPLLERGMTPPIKHNIRSPPSFATSRRRHLINDALWWSIKPKSGVSNHPHGARLQTHRCVPAEDRRRGRDCASCASFRALRA